MPVILGGGLSGLSAAYYLTKRLVDPITIYESTKRLGGWIKTEVHAEDGFLFEFGPRTIRPTGLAAANTLQLIGELNLEEHLVAISAAHLASRNRMLYFKDQLCLLPTNFSSTLKTVPPFSKPIVYALITDLFFGKKRKAQDESIYSFSERRFGEEFAKYVTSAMICGICAGDAKEISVRFLMNDFYEKEQKYGGVMKGIIMNKLFGKDVKKDVTNQVTENNPLLKKARDGHWEIYSLVGGMSVLPETLATHALNHGIEINTETECRKLTFSQEKVIVNVNGNDVVTDHVISSIPSYKLGQLVSHEHPELSQKLKEIPYVSVAVVHLQYSRDDLIEKPAFGLLVPPSENLPILGIIFDSCCFEMRENTVLTVMMGGKWFNKYFGENPTVEQLQNTALQYVEKILKIQEVPNCTKVSILKNCIPQYTVGHRERVDFIRKYIKENKLPLSMCGAAYDGVGVNDVIFSARKVAESFKQNYEN